MLKGRIFKILGLYTLLSINLLSKAQKSTFDTKISIKHKPTTFGKLLKTISRKADVVFSFNPNILPLYYTPRIRFSNVSLNKLLIKILNNNGIEFASFTDRTIILTKSKVKPKPPTLFYNGYVESKKSGERLGYVYLLDSNQQIISTTNAQGYFSLALKAGRNIIHYSYINHQIFSDTFFFKRNMKQKIKLVANSNFIESITIKQKLNEIKLKQKYPEKTIISFENTKTLPLFLGEKDMVQYLKLYPGVSGGTDVLGGLHIRGGRPEHNLITIDDIPIYKTHHLFGLFSIFDPSSISNTELSKNNMPIDLGGRLSSAIRVNSKDGDKNKHHAEVNVGLITAKARIEGPIIKDRTTFHVSFRRSYVDYLIAGLSATINIVNEDDSISSVSAGYYFYDVNAKVTHKFNNQSKLSFTFYKGEDRAFFENNSQNNFDTLSTTEKRKNSLNWGSNLYSAKFNTLLTPKTKMKIMAGFQNYNYRTTNSLDLNADTKDSLSNRQFSYKFHSGIADFSSSVGLKTRLNKKHSIKYGAKFVHHNFRPSTVTTTQSASFNIKNTTYNPQILSVETSIYAGLKSRINPKLTLTYGTHHTLAFVNKKMYHLFEPRLALKYSLNNTIKLFSSLSRNQQFVHLLSNPGIGLPSDIWLPSTKNIKPEKSLQATMGVILKSKTQFVSFNAFAKKMENLLEYKTDVSNFRYENNWENQVVSGSGNIMGLETEYLYKGKKNSVQFAYTLSKNIKTFGELNDGKPFNDKFDRLHNLSISYSKQINKKVIFSTFLNYNSGYWITTPTRKQLSPTPAFPNRVVYLYDQRNNYHAKDYFRLDFNYRFTRKRKYYTRVWTLGIFNVTNRLNPTFFQLTKNKNGNEQFTKLTLFPFLPNISYSIKF